MLIILVIIFAIRLKVQPVTDSAGVKEGSCLMSMIITMDFRIAVGVEGRWPRIFATGRKCPKGTPTTQCTRRWASACKGVPPILLLQLLLDLSNWREAETSDASRAAGL